MGLAIPGPGPSQLPTWLQNSSNVPWGKLALHFGLLLCPIHSTVLASPRNSSFFFSPEEPLCMGQFWSSEMSQISNVSGKKTAAHHQFTWEGPFPPWYLSLSGSYFFHCSPFSSRTMILILFLSPWLWQWEWCLQKPTTSYPEAEVLQFCFLPLPIEIRSDSLIFSFSHTLTCFFLLFKEVIGLSSLWKQMSTNS